MTDEIPASGDAWTRVRSALRSELGTDAFQNWIDPLVYVGADHGVLHLAAPTSFFGNWVMRNYGETIRQVMCKDGMPVSRLEFAVAPAGAPALAARPREPAGVAAAPVVTELELPASPIDGRCTFDNFVVGKPNELAHAAARRVAEGVAACGYLVGHRLGSHLGSP